MISHPGQVRDKAVHTSEAAAAGGSLSLSSWGVLRWPPLFPYEGRTPSSGFSGVSIPRAPSEARNHHTLPRVLFTGKVKLTFSVGSPLRNTFK